MKIKEIQEAVERLGWVHERTSGSHLIYKHPTFKGLLVVPYPPSGKELNYYLVKKILRDAKRGPRFNQGECA